MTALRRFAATTIGVVLTVIIGLIGAGAASASTIGPGPLCIPHNGGWDCAYGTSPVKNTDNLDATNWYTAPVGGGYGYIQQANTFWCIQLNASAGYITQEAVCEDSNSMKWEWYGNGELRNAWDPSQCLTFNYDNQDYDTVACNGQWYQTFDPNLI